jgi:hypothetical protein
MTEKEFYVAELVSDEGVYSDEPIGFFENHGQAEACVMEYISLVDDLVGVVSIRTAILPSTDNQTTLQDLKANL